jgi:hypothetical protein
MELVTTAGGSRYACSVGGSLTGRGADLIIVDDPLKAEEAMSEPARRRVIDWFGGTLVTRLNDKERGPIITIMQRLHENDLAGHLIEQGGWEHLNLPAIAIEDSVPQQPVPLKGNYILREWFRFYEQPPALGPADRIVQSWTSPRRWAKSTTIRFARRGT